MAFIIMIFFVMCGYFSTLVNAQNNETECVCLQDMIEAGEVNMIVRMYPFPDNTGRILVADWRGILWIYYTNGTRLPAPYANLTDIIEETDSDSNFLGFAFHPNYMENGRIFMSFNIRHPVGVAPSLREYKVHETNPNIIDRSTEVVLINQTRQPNGISFVSGGETFFGHDGYLYVGYGDGDHGDPLYVAQNRSEFRGKIIRLDVDNIPEGKAYGIPPDNPFIDEEGTLDEIFALGFRQPWTITVDPGDPDTGEGAGRILLGDCGQKAYEEIDLVEMGGNYGWSSREGHSCFRYEYCGQIGPEVFPIHTYSHEQGELFGRCVITGHVYRGQLNPGLSGWLIFGDFGIRELRRLKQSETGEWLAKALPFCDRDMCEALEMTTTYYNDITSFGLDQNGEVYLLSTTDQTTDSVGRVQKIVDPNTYTGVI